MVGVGNGAINFLTTVAVTIPAGAKSGLVFPSQPSGGFAPNGAGLVANRPIRPRHARITVEGSPTRWGGDVSSTVGHWVSDVYPNNVIEFMDAAQDYVGLLQQIQFIALNGQLTLQCSYFD